jgi:hypothetical protein
LTKGNDQAGGPCPLLEIKRILEIRPVISAYDPKRTFASACCCGARAFYGPPFRAVI